MRIDNQSAINPYNQRSAKSDNGSEAKSGVRSREVESNKNSSNKEIEDLKQKGIRKVKLDDFLPGKLNSSEDQVEISSPSIGSSLELTAEQILEKINESIKKDFPDYVVSTSPEDNTPEKISNNIVQGATALFSTFAAQNKDLAGEELLSSFMSTIRGGVEKGYGQAKEILGGIGALKVSGVEDAISETMRLVEVGFKSFETKYRIDKGLPELADKQPEDPKEIVAEVPEQA